MQYYNDGDLVEFSPNSGYEHRADMRGQIMVTFDPRVRAGNVLMVKDYKVVEQFSLIDDNALERMKDISKFDAIVLHPNSIPEELLDAAQDETQRRARQNLS